MVSDGVDGIRRVDQLAICYFTINIIIFRRSSSVEILSSCDAELFRVLLLLVNSCSRYNNAYIVTLHYEKYII